MSPDIVLETHSFSGSRGSGAADVKRPPRKLERLAEVFAADGMCEVVVLLLLRLWRESLGKSLVEEFLRNC